MSAEKKVSEISCKISPVHPSDRYADNNIATNVFNICNKTAKLQSLKKVYRNYCIFNIKNKIVGRVIFYLINATEKVTYICLSRGLHGPDFSVQARPGPHGYDLGPARPEAKKKVSARARHGP